MNAKQLKIAAHMVGLRDAMRSLYAERWEAVSAPYREVIKAEMDKTSNTNPLSAVIPIAKAMDAAGENPTVLMASAVKLAEFP